MPGRYVLDDNDRRILKDVVRRVRAGKMSQRPIPTRRRYHGGGGRVRLIVGVFIETIPAATLSVTGSLPSLTITHVHGYAANAVILLRRKSDGSGWEADLDANDNPKVVGGVNHALSRLRASQSNPVALLGYVESLTVSSEDVQAFVPANWDNRSLFGFDKATHQSPYHADDSDEFILGAEDCTPVEP
jgi:hypothetical protein